MISIKSLIKHFRKHKKRPNNTVAAKKASDSPYGKFVAENFKVVEYKKNADIQLKVHVSHFSDGVLVSIMDGDKRMYSDFYKYYWITNGEEEE